MMWLLHLGLTLLGLLAGWLLFRKLTFLPESEAAAPCKLSVVIPARNEAAALPLLLSDLLAQDLPPFEILCVDDLSEDGTAEAARSLGAKVVRVGSKPAGWVGKSYACQLGAEQAEGDLLLFLDADVRLSPGALRHLCAAHQRTGEVISVQPYHQMGRWIEQAALFFNLILVAAMTRLLPGHKTPGLYGPVILIPRDAYFRAGGHAAVRGDILDDLALGAQLERHDIPYQRYQGGSTIGFRMYPRGFREIVQGFTKNFASGAGRTSPLVFALVFLWIMGLTRACIEGVRLLALGPSWPQLLYGLLYFAFALQLWYHARKLGSFGLPVCLLYPLDLVFFLLVFLSSALHKLLGRPVTWKGRKVKGERA